MKKIGFILLALLPTATYAQTEPLAIEGRVTCGGKSVPYATLQLKGTSLGVSCNDNGQYMLKIPAGHEADTVVVRSIGFEQCMLTVSDLMRDGGVKMKVHSVQLQEVKVDSYRKPLKLIRDAVKRIDDNFHQRTTYSTFFYRDWRALDDELYLFDEAVIGVKRIGYGAYSDKRSYRFYRDEREMDSNYKTLLRHRLLVYDRALLEDKLTYSDGVDLMMEYADNELFFDPVATPDATYMLADRVIEKNAFWPIQEFLWDNEPYYYVRSKGPRDIHYEYTIRKSDLAIVRITSVQKNAKSPAPSESWVNVNFTRLVIDCDSSAWTYDVRDGEYTLTHYYNNTSFHLESSRPGYEEVEQHWQECVDWTLTDFSRDDTTHRDFIEVKPQTIVSAFGESDFNTDFWGHDNSILIDSLPLRLLKEKLLQDEE